MVGRRLRGVISTVGMAETLPQALMKVISQLNPDYIAFIATIESRKNVDKLVTSGGLEDREYEVFMLNDLNNFDEACRVAKGAMDWMVAHGISPGDVSVDFTGGTKAMSAGAVHAGIGYDVGALVYVGGERGEGSFVIPGYEVLVIASSPSVESAKKMLERAIEMFNRFDYPATLGLCEVVRQKQIRDIDDRCSLLEHVAQAYWRWDLLDWKGSYESLSDLERDDARRLGIIELWGKNKEVLRSLSSSVERNVFQEEQLSDLIASVDRRIARGEYTGAVARIYRSIELLGQIALWQGYSLDTRDLDLSIIRKELSSKYEKYRNTDGVTRLPLNGCYKLLKDLGDPLGDVLSSDEFRKIQYQRNHSAMAHGLRPVSEVHAESGRKYLLDLASKYVKNLDELVAKSTFPTIPEEFAYSESSQ